MNRFQLKHLSINPIYEKPIIVSTNLRFTQIVIDNILTKNQEYVKVLFISTEQNTILKYMLLNTNSNSEHFPTVCLLEEIEIFDHSIMKLKNSINNLVLLSNNYYSGNENTGVLKMRSLLISTSFNFIKMPVANCESQLNYYSCLNLMDPYCIWDSKAQKCLFIFKTNETLFHRKQNNLFLSISQNIKFNTNLHQNIFNTCPTTNNPGKILFFSKKILIIDKLL